MLNIWEQQRKPGAAMPHITIEYSANVADHHDVQHLIDAVHHAALDHGLASVDALRTRAAPRVRYRVADGHPDNAFIAIAVRIGPGRSADDKQSFLAAVLDAAEASLADDAAAGPVGPPANPLAIAWSIELTEIDPEFRINRNHVRPALQHRNPTPQPTEETT